MVKRLEVLLFLWLITFLLLLCGCRNSRSAGIPFWLNNSRWGYLEGYVKDSTGRPLKDVTVTYGGKSMQTTETGFYAFEELEEGSFVLTGMKDGYANYSTVLTARKGERTRHDFTLLQMGSLGGIVKDTGGNALGGVLVDCDGHVDETDEYGQFIIDNIREGARTVKATKEGYFTWEGEVNIIKNTTVNLQICMRKGNY